MHKHKKRAAKSAATRAHRTLRKLDEAVIARRPTRRYRAAAFQAYVLTGSAGFVALAVAARTVPYFAIDLRVTRNVQNYRGPMIDDLMQGISWIGFKPQSLAFGLVPPAVLFSLGLRWEAVATLVAASSVALTEFVKLAVERPRPDDDLVDVFRELPTSGFPSGHVLSTTSLCGFLAFLSYTLLKPSSGRIALLVFFALLAGLMGPSRIYQGQHWFSDVIGAYLLGSLWLALTIRIYRWGKPHFFVDQPVAPDAPAAQA